jgi:hypothetical protein
MTYVHAIYIHRHADTQTTENVSALPDHFYANQPYNGQYLQHRFRVNFNLQLDSVGGSAMR